MESTSVEKILQRIGKIWFQIRNLILTREWNRIWQRANSIGGDRRFGAYSGFKRDAWNFFLPSSIGMRSSTYHERQRLPVWNDFSRCDRIELFLGLSRRHKRPEMGHAECFGAFVDVLNSVRVYEKLFTFCRVSVHGWSIVSRNWSL